MSTSPCRKSYDHRLRDITCAGRKYRQPDRDTHPNSTSRTRSPRKRAILGVRDAVSGLLTVVTSATKRSTDFISLLEMLDRKYAPEATGNKLPVVLVLDNGPIHTSKLSRKALADRSWIHIEWLPKYAPELNDIERDWRHLKRHFLANQAVLDLDDLDRRIHAAVAEINRRRAALSLEPFRRAA